MKKIGLLERMLHCVKIDKFKKMTLYIVYHPTITVFVVLPPPELQIEPIMFGSI